MNVPHYSLKNIPLTLIWTNKSLSVIRHVLFTSLNWYISGHPVCIKRYTSKWSRGLITLIPLVFAFTAKTRHWVESLLFLPYSKCKKDAQLNLLFNKNYYLVDRLSHAHFPEDFNRDLLISILLLKFHHLFPFIFTHLTHHFYLDYKIEWLLSLVLGEI